MKIEYLIQLFNTIDPMYLDESGKSFTSNAGRAMHCDTEAEAVVVINTAPEASYVIVKLYVKN